MKKVLNKLNNNKKKKIQLKYETRNKMNVKDIITSESTE